MTRKMVELADGTFVPERRGGIKITLETGLAIAAIFITMGGLIVYAKRVPDLEDKQTAQGVLISAISQKVNDMEKGQDRIEKKEDRILDFLERGIGR